MGDGKWFPRSQKSRIQLNEPFEESKRNDQSEETFTILIVVLFSQGQSRNMNFSIPLIFPSFKNRGILLLKKKNGIFGDSHIQKTGNNGVAVVGGEGGVPWACPIMPISLPYSSSPLPPATAGLWGIWREHPCSIPSIHSSIGSRSYSSHGRGFKETSLEWSIFSSSWITLEFPWLPCEMAWLLQNTTKNTKTQWFLEVSLP